MGRMNQILIESWPLDAGGVRVSYNGKTVGDGLNVVSAFMTLGGLLAGNPCEVKMEMESPRWGTLARSNYEQGRTVVADFDRHCQAVKRLIGITDFERAGRALLVAMAHGSTPAIKKSASARKRTKK